MTTVENVAKLKIARVTPADVGIYTCEARNEAGVATSRASIALEQEKGIAPTFLKPVKVTFNEAEDKAAISCQVHGVPTPNVKWFRGIEEVAVTENIVPTYDVETGTVTLTVTHPKLYGRHAFTLQAVNTYGRAIGNANTITVLEKSKGRKAVSTTPKVTPLNAQVVRQGSTLVFESKFEGITKPEIKWL